MYSNVNLSLRKYVKGWIFCCLLMVTLMVIVGGLTRLTESGLSMVEWKPTTLLPPLTNTEWQEEFRQYQSSPQFIKINAHMNVEEFKQIFWLEYIHRLLGRCVGFVFFLPYLYFLCRKALGTPLAFKLGGIFLLGGMQGVIGWYMVKSGLVDQPWVSPVRLAMHLGMAFIIFGLLLWQFLALRNPSHANQTPTSASFSPFGVFCLISLYIQILFGALVAGMDAGLVFNTFPDMNGEYFPEGMVLLTPHYRNLIENPTAAHAIHRYGAFIVTLLLTGLTIMCFKNKQFKKSFAIIAALALQITLGAYTVIYSVPIILASAHQAVALALFAATILALKQPYRVTSS